MTSTIEYLGYCDVAGKFIVRQKRADSTGFDIHEFQTEADATAFLIANQTKLTDLESRLLTTLAHAVVATRSLNEAVVPADHWRARAGRLIEEARSRA